MQAGDNKDISIPAAEAYGERQDDLVTVVTKDRLPENIDAKVGVVLQVTTETGVPVNFAVTDVKEENVTLDANHPLAGKDLSFSIELMEILDA